MAIIRTYPPTFTVDTTTGVIIGEAYNAPDDIMGQPTHRIRFRLAGTVEAIPLNPEPDAPADDQEG